MGRDVLIVEDRRILAESLGQALSAVGLEPRLVMEPSLEAVEASLEHDDPAAAIVAIGFGGDSMTESAVGLLTSHGIPTIIMTGGEDRLRMARCVAEGAIGIIDRNSSFSTVASVIKEAAGFESLLSLTEVYRLQDDLRRHQAAVTKRRKPFEQLTERERAVLESLTNGQRAEEIADQAFVSISTVRSQIRAILTKLGVSSQLAAVAMANRADVFDRAK